jgi:hypothetical protein
MLVPVMIAVVLVVFISPIALSVPSLRVRIPPPVPMAPAIFASFREVVAGAVGLGAAIAVVLDSLVKPMVGATNTFLAVIVIGAQAGGGA